MRKLWLSLLSSLILSCVTAPSSEISIPGYEQVNPKFKSKTKIEGVDLGINGVSNGFQEITNKQKISPSPFPEEDENQQAESLEELLLLEISANRGENIPETVAGLITFATTYENEEVAERAYELSALIYNQNFAQLAAEKWYELAPTSLSAQGAYIKELLIASEYERAFEVMARRIEQGRDSDFRPIAHFYRIVDEEQSRSLITTYNRYISIYPEKRRNLEAGAFILRYKLAHFLFYHKEYVKSLSLLNLIISSSRDTNLKQQATELKGRIYLMTSREVSEYFYANALKQYSKSYNLHVHYALYLLQQGKKSQAERMLIQFAKNQLAEDETVYRLLVMAIGAKKEGLTELYDYIYNKISDVKDEDEKKLLQGILNYVSNDIAVTEDSLSRVSIDSSFAVSALSLRLKNTVRAQQFDAGNAILEEVLGNNRQLYIFLINKYVTELVYIKQENIARKLIENMFKQLGQDRDALETAAYAYYEIGDNSAMARSFERAMRLDPKDHGLKNSYGYSLADKNIQLDKAKQLIDEAIEANPISTAYVDSLAWWNYRKGNLEEARYLLEWAYRKNNDPEIATHLGEVLWRLGQKDQAEYLWLINSEIYPGSYVLFDTMTRYQVDWRFLQQDVHFFNSKLIQ